LVADAVCTFDDFNATVKHAAQPQIQMGLSSTLQRGADVFGQQFLITSFGFVIVAFTRVHPTHASLFVSQEQRWQLSAKARESRRKKNDRFSGASS
jgi:hypothetical protein